MQVVDVAQEQLARALISRRVHRLRKIDDHRPVARHQHIEVRQVAVHHAGAQHAHDLAQELLVRSHGAFAGEGDFAEPRRRLAVRVLDELHDQHAFQEVIGPRHAHVGVGEPVDHLDLGRLPRRFVLRLSVLRSLVHRALIAAVSHVAAFDVVGAVLKRAIVRLFVDLGDALDALARHQVDLGFLAALERSDDLVEDAVMEQDFEIVRNTHAFRYSPN